MNLAWTDRSNDEVGYIVYRDGQVIANLGPNSTSYTDVAAVSAGQSVSYKVEVYNDSVIKALDSVDAGEEVSPEHLDLLIERSFEILRNAAREIPDAEAQWRKLKAQ